MTEISTPGLHRRSCVLVCGGFYFGLVWCALLGPGRPDASSDAGGSMATVIPWSEVVRNAEQLLAETRELIDGACRTVWRGCQPRFGTSRAIMRAGRRPTDGLLRGRGSQCVRRARPQPVCPAPQPHLLPGTRPLRSRTLDGPRRRLGQPARPSVLRSRQPKMHRRHPRHDLDDPDSRHHRLYLAAHSRTRTQIRPIARATLSTGPLPMTLHPRR